MAAPILELVPEPVGGERFAELGQQKGHVAANVRRRDALRERGVQWNVDINRIPMFVFCLPKANTAIPDMLATKARPIFTPAGCVAQQIERETRLRSERVPLVELLDFLIRPSVMPV